MYGGGSSCGGVGDIVRTARDGGHVRAERRRECILAGADARRTAEAVSGHHKCSQTSTPAVATSSAANTPTRAAFDMETSARCRPSARSAAGALSMSALRVSRERLQHAREPNRDAREARVVHGMRQVGAEW